MKNILLLMILSSFLQVCGQPINPKKTFTIMSYNVENLFDTIDNPEKSDEEYLPSSKLQWNTEKYFAKINKIAKVIKSIHSEELPEIISLIEIENKAVLEDLISKTELKNSCYKIVHYDSPDPRGVDVGLLYRSDEFKVIKSFPIKISFNGDTAYKTRDILYVKGLMGKSDTLHIFVNHWKSRNSKDEETELKRIFEASVLRQKVDSIQNSCKNAKIVITGDFNDEPTNKSLSETLKAGNTTDAPSFNMLYNMMYDKKLKAEGTYFYRSEWSMLDNIIVSYPLINAAKGTYKTNYNSSVIFKQDWMLYTDKNGNKVPNRTFAGEKYTGGISDHLPIYIELIK
ncbi:MAG: hypothetical protein WCK02_14690 [Bacteroidota bacterium]